MRRLLSLSLTLILLGTAWSRADSLPQDGSRVLFLGDSNTYAGHFISYLDAYLFLRHPERKVELINLGLPSETVSGESEADHPYPRPDVHERAERALKQVKPNLVVICYGMNDGIYSPLDKQRRKMYQDGLLRLIAKAEKAGAKVVLLTPAPFDPLPLGDKVLSAGAPKYSWMRPYARYDDVLRDYSEWIGTLEKKFLVVDAHGAMRRHLARMRQLEPRYHLSGDGIHPNPAGHWLIARELLAGWKVPPVGIGLDIDLDRGKAEVSGNAEGLTIRPDRIELTWACPLPLPIDPRWDEAFRKEERIGRGGFHRFDLAVRGKPAKERYALTIDGIKLGVFTAAQLRDGVNLQEFPKVKPVALALEIARKLDQRQQIMARAWLQAVGHKRPGVPKGLPVVEARHRGDKLLQEARALREGFRSITVRLEAVP